MITVGMDYEVLPGQEPAFEGAFRGLAEALAGAPGHVASRLYREVERPRCYLVYSEWSDRDAFVRFVRSPEFAAVTAWSRGTVLARPPRHRILTPDASLDGG